MSSFTMSYRKVGNRDNRRDKRLPLPVFTVRINGQVCDTLNWSLGGLLVTGYVGIDKPDDVVKVEIKIKDSTGDYAVKVSAKVIRVDHRANTIALRFEEMSPLIYDFFERSFAARFRSRANR
ncbi:MAG TPA: PilZ domain-containing protein [Dongiaceae bacterium]|jgi:hypothetical protein|nr:PilZ domain-containing protein [Dongiaceae bacterium]